MFVWKFSSLLKCFINFRLPIIKQSHQLHHCPQVWLLWWRGKSSLLYRPTWHEPIHFKTSIGTFTLDSDSIVVWYNVLLSICFLSNCLIFNSFIRFCYLCFRLWLTIFPFWRPCHSSWIDIQSISSIMR